MIHILKPGLLTTIQDLGRYGFQKHGVIASGVMDPVAHRIANLLIGNDDTAPTMEITLMGPVIEFQEEAWISICGGNLSPMVDGDRVKMWKPIFIEKGSELRFGHPKQGFRAYLAIGGGFNVPRVMNSSSTYIRARLGGFHGRALEDGDVLSVNTPSAASIEMSEQYKVKKSKAAFMEADWSVSSEFTAYLRSQKPIRVIEGREFHLFDEMSQQSFFQSSFEIDSKSDRMGYRLKGPRLSLKNKKDILSEAVTFGTIQVPPEGHPILLLADRQTTGGYPKIGQVASVDFQRVAQMRPGERMTFELITHEKAQELYLEREHQLQQLKRGIQLQYR